MKIKTNFVEKAISENCYPKLFAFTDMLDKLTFLTKPTTCKNARKIEGNIQRAFSFNVLRFFARCTKCFKDEVGMYPARFS